VGRGIHLWKGSEGKEKTEQKARTATIAIGVATMEKEGKNTHDSARELRKARKQKCGRVDGESARGWTWGKKKTAAPGESGRSQTGCVGGGKQTVGDKMHEVAMVT